MVLVITLFFVDDDILKLCTTEKLPIWWSREVIHYFVIFMNSFSRLFFILTVNFIDF